MVATRHQARKPTHGTYRFVPHPATGFDPVFTAPTYLTFVVIITGWILSQRHRYVTEVIFSSGHVGDGHWSRFHRFFSHAAWDIDTFSMPWPVGRHDSRPGCHAPLGCRRHPLSQTRVDPLRRRHALRSTHLQSRQVPGSWGHDWVVLTLIVAFPSGLPPKSSPCPSPCVCTATAKG